MNASILGAVLTSVSVLTMLTIGTLAEQPTEASSSKPIVSAELVSSAKGSVLTVAGIGQTKSLAREIGRWDGSLPSALIGKRLVSIECVRSGSPTSVDKLQLIGNGYCVNAERTSIGTIEWTVHWPSCVAPRSTRKASASSDPQKGTPAFLVDATAIRSSAGNCDSFRVTVQL